LEDGRWKMEDGRWEMGDGRWEMVGEKGDFQTFRLSDPQPVT
jgi:hypothetical protein